MLDVLFEGMLKLHFMMDATPKTFLEIFGPRGSLGSTTAKIWVLFASGSFGEITRSDLLEIVKIRNAFAHSALPITFRTPQIQRACRKLKAVRAFIEQGIVSDARMNIAEWNSRDVYLMTCITICNLLRRSEIDRLKKMQSGMLDLVAEVKRRKKKDQDISALTKGVLIP